MVEGARLESVCASNGTAGSNPVLSASKITHPVGCVILLLMQKGVTIRTRTFLFIERFGYIGRFFEIEQKSN